MPVPVLTVTQLNFYVKTLIDSDERLAGVYLSGEISNFTRHYKSGHLYFTLKDNQCAVKAVMFSRSASFLKFEPENGMKVIVRGRVSLYDRDGSYQFYCDEMHPDGAGELAVAFEQLKLRLEKEGLFNPEHKKKLPVYPRRIGVITSPRGAAIEDIKNIISRRWPLATLIIAPVSVQGEGAAASLTQAVREFDKKQCADVIIIGRGGGSAEDLWCFNDENLACAIYDCSVPVVSGVGHEIDFTICDFVSDMRAPTPSAAAELTTPDIYELAQYADSLYIAVKSRTLKRIADEKMILQRILMRRSFSSPERFFEKDILKTANLQVRLNGAFSSVLSKEGKRTASLAGRLDSLSPLKVLSRGYSAALKENGELARASSLIEGERIRLILSDGQADCTVNAVRPKGDSNG